ncbi:MAG TPA: bifunctional 4-hydroxy-2-oxoglutarate aldolase/2-dehydro-3-deoxy-phosphogluconate aldolase [Candidatus Angelobacter sp.]|nr:bifunctional 4-hydroxy-2-oxoglutarate aldolase/2-dehydro-3-deoxy-phosphogluconate aldolase [Candidatus Angelobacter sp.]
MSVDGLRGGTVADVIRRHRLIAVLRRVEPRTALLALVGELADAGVRCFEITMDAPSATEDLGAVRATLRARGDDEPSVVGAGTVLTEGQLDAGVDAGADFAVSPILDAELVANAVGRGIPILPGAMTPTEVRAAWEAGATFVKLFPASAVGPAMVRELRGPLPAIELVPTGGVDASNARAFLDAGASAVGIGGALIGASADERRAIVGAVIGREERT